MADGFLAPDGSFTEKKEIYHAQTARQILGDHYNSEDPVGELIKGGYVVFIEFRKPGETVSAQPDLDFVLGKSSGNLTDIQKEWIISHVELISNHQQFIINEDKEKIFRNLMISNVRLYPECHTCKWLPKRKKWCDGIEHSEPKECIVCPYNIGI